MQRNSIVLLCEARLRSENPVAEEKDYAEGSYFGEFIGGRFWRMSGRVIGFNATPAHSLNRQYIQGATNAQNAQEFRFNMHLGGSFFLPEAVF